MVTGWCLGLKMFNYFCTFYFVIVMTTVRNTIIPDGSYISWHEVNSLSVVNYFRVRFCSSMHHKHDDLDNQTSRQRIIHTAPTKESDKVPFSIKIQTTP